MGKPGLREFVLKLREFVLKLREFVLKLRERVSFCRILDVSSA